MIGTRGGKVSYRMLFRKVREAGARRFSSWGRFVYGCLPRIQVFWVGGSHEMTSSSVQTAKMLARTHDTKEAGLLDGRRARCGPIGPRVLPTTFCFGNATRWRKTFGILCAKVPRFVQSLNKTVMTFQLRRRRPSHSNQNISKLSDTLGFFLFFDKLWNYQPVLRKFLTPRAVAWNINDMLWKRQPTRANCNLAAISTSDPFRPFVARNSVRVHFGSPNCDSAEKVPVGDTPARSTGENVSTCYLGILCERDRAVSDAGAHLQCKTSTAVASFRKEWFAPREHIKL